MRSVTVIGSGNAFNTDGRGHACFLAESSDGELILVDCGATSLGTMRRLGLPYERIDVVLITHFHGDHLLGLPFVLLSMNLERARERPLTIAGPPGIATVVRGALELAYPGIAYRFEIRFEELTGSPARFGRTRVESLPVTHAPESLGFRIQGVAGRTIAFSGDSAFDDKLFRLVADVDLAVIELGLLAQSDPPLAHVSLDELERGWDRIRARKLLFTHLTDDIAARIEAAGLGIAARDGLTVSV